MYGPAVCRSQSAGSVAVFRRGRGRQKLIDVRRPVGSVRPSWLREVCPRRPPGGETDGCGAVCLARSPPQSGRTVLPQCRISEAVMDVILVPSAD